MPVCPAQGMALDGQTVCGSPDRSRGKAASHLGSAWASASRLVGAQVKLQDQSPERTALPELLRQVASTGCRVRMDALGCQRQMAEQLVAQEADALVALKAQQPDLLEEVMDCFSQAEADASHAVCHQAAETSTTGHGRLEMRRLRVLTEPEYLTWLQAEQHWPGLRAVGRVEAERRSGEERTRETRSYGLSRARSAATCGQAVRSHWGSENAVQWV